MDLSLSVSRLFASWNSPKLENIKILWCMKQILGQVAVPREGFHVNININIQVSVEETGGGLAEIGSPQLLEGQGSFPRPRRP